MIMAGGKCNYRSSWFIFQPYTAAPHKVIGSGHKSRWRLRLFPNTLTEMVLHSRQRTTRTMTLSFWRLATRMCQTHLTHIGEHAVSPISRTMLTHTQYPVIYDTAIARSINGNGPVTLWSSNSFLSQKSRNSAGPRWSHHVNYFKP